MLMQGTMARAKTDPFLLGLFPSRPRTPAECRFDDDYKLNYTLTLRYNPAYFHVSGPNFDCPYLSQIRKLGHV